MRKVFIGIIIVITFFTLSFVFAACNKSDLAVESSNSPETKDEYPTTSPEMSRHEVTLNLKNYLTYLNITESSYNSDTIPRFTFSGCLSYAFYDNVVITISYQGYSSYGTPPIETTTVTLNANGQGTVYLHNVSSASITGISGNVIYWI